MRKPFVAGNWKMNTNNRSSSALAESIVCGLQQVGTDKLDVAICPPFVYLQQVAKAISASNVALGAQNVYYQDNGAFTGEISCQMLKDIGCTYVIIGHSERRHVIGETDELINKKLIAAINSGLLPIFCVGELLEEREAGKTEKVITTQIKNGLAGLGRERVSAITIAYEPVWAIGTGKTATTKQAEDVHRMIRELITEMYGEELANNVRIQYGGSVKPSNASELMAEEDVDGLLVGGASLKENDFIAIIKTSWQAK
jgi:triosephosphate isomerase